MDTTVGGQNPRAAWMMELYNAIMQ